MKVTVLGCSGGIGRARARTTALLIDDDMLIDAGTGVDDLDLSELERIERVFVTHSHLDHVACLPMIMDAAAGQRSAPLVVHCIRETELALRLHLFNGHIWPDFTRIPSAAKPFLRFEPIEIGRAITCHHPLHGPRTITALPADHATPAVGYRLDGAKDTLAFTGDTTVCAALAQQLATESPRFELFITHLKPGYESATMREVRTLLRHFRPTRLARGDVFDL